MSSFENKYDSNRKNNSNKTMTFDELISGIDTILLKEEFIEIQTLMNEIFMNSSFIKETQQKKEIIEKISTLIFSINENKKENINMKLVYISLSFLTLLESKIKNIPIYILQSVLIDNEKMVNMYKIIYEQIYQKKLEIDNFQLPNLKNFVNFTFKYPDIINNFFEINFINVSSYYNTLFIMFLKNIEIIKITNSNIIQKIYILKLFDILYTSFLDENINIENIKNFFDIVDEEELYKDEFYKKIFIFADYNTIEDFDKMGKIYNFLKNFEKFGKMQKIIRKNMYFISLIINSDNEFLQKKFFDDIIFVLKQKTNILEEIEIYEFYQVFFCLFYLLEKRNGFNYLDIFDSMMKIAFIVMEKVKDKNKKGIIQLYLRYVKKKMIEYLKSKGAKSEIDIDVEKQEEENIFENKSTIDLLSFTDEHLKKYQKNYFIETKEESFKYKFYKYVLGIDVILLNKINNEEMVNINNKLKNDKSERPKTIYKSVKFQKKYGVFEETKNKLLNEMNKEKTSLKNLDIISEDINLPFYSNKNNLKIHLETKDDFNDLYKMKSPLYLKDCLLGLNSQYKDRQELSLKALPGIIDNQPMDLDYYVKNLTLVLLSMHDNFDLDENDELKTLALVKLAKYSPNEVTLIFCEKFFSENNCGLKLKFLIINVLNQAVTELSEYYIKNKKPKVNNFHIYFTNIIFPLLSYLKKAKLTSLLIFKDFDLLLSKFIILISNIINVSENHPLIYRALFEVFDLFKAIINLKELKSFKTFSLLESLNCFVNVTLNFYEKNFVEIYPEFLPKFREEINFLNDLLDDKQLNDDLRFKILGTLNKFTIQSDKLHESFFGIENNMNFKFNLDANNINNISNSLLI